MGSTMHKIQVAELGARLAKRGLTLTYEQASDDSPWRWTLKDKGGVMARLVELEHVERWLTDQESCDTDNGSTARMRRTTHALQRANAIGWRLDKRGGMYQLRGADEEPIAQGLDIYSIEDALERAESVQSALPASASDYAVSCTACTVTYEQHVPFGGAKPNTCGACGNTDKAKLRVTYLPALKPEGDFDVDACDECERPAASCTCDHGEPALNEDLDPEKARHDREVAMFGMKTSLLDKALDDRLRQDGRDFPMNRHGGRRANIAVSMLSDVQELIDAREHEQARLLINAVKHLLVR